MRCNCIDFFISEKVTTVQSFAKHPLTVVAIDPVLQDELVFLDSLRLYYSEHGS